jgi:hypothetical protein
MLDQASARHLDQLLLLGDLPLLNANRPSSVPTAAFAAAEFGSFSRLVSRITKAIHCSSDQSAWLSTTMARPNVLGPRRRFAIHQL